MFPWGRRSVVGHAASETGSCEARTNLGEGQYNKHKGNKCLINLLYHGFFEYIFWKCPKMATYEKLGIHFFWSGGILNNFL